jgi:hypothetical protein
MPAKEIAARLKARPFVPFIIRMEDGRAYEVQHPQLVLLGKSTVTLGIPDTETREVQGVPLMDYSVTLSLLHIVSIEAAASGAA